MKTLTRVVASRPTRIRSGPALLIAGLLMLAPAAARGANGDCGQPVTSGAKPSASDCLYVLKSAVGAVECDCVCDTNGSGSTLASDALLCLGVAVGYPLVMNCPCADLTIETPEFDLEIGQTLANCFYFRTSNTQTLAIRQWASTTLPATQQLIVFLTVDEDGDPVDVKPPGTLSSTDCGIGGSPPPRWTYGATTSPAELVFPADDGGGKPVAAEIPPNSAGYILMYSVNLTDQVVRGGAVIEADALAQDTEFTRTAAYVTYNSNISISSGTVGVVEQAVCNVPPDSRFWWMTTHTHRYSVSTEIKDGPDVVFESGDFENPGAAVWDGDPFYEFDSGKLTTRCTYTNTTNRTVTSGDSFLFDEQCTAIAYFFPAERPLLCINGFGPF